MPLGAKIYINACHHVNLGLMNPYLTPWVTLAMVAAATIMVAAGVPVVEVM